MRGAQGKIALDECPTSTCLTVYVAPWCPHCRATGPLIRAVRENAAFRGVTTRIVVGMDEQEAVEKYADEFGPETLLDLQRRFKVGSVPAVYVSDNSGRILKEFHGLPESSPPPDSATLRQIEADFFGLP